MNTDTDVDHNQFIISSVLFSYVILSIFVVYSPTSGNYYIV